MSLFLPQRRGDTEVQEQMRRPLSGTSAGVLVTQDRALRHSAVWASLAAISEALTQMPIDEEAKQGDTWIKRPPPRLFFEPCVDTPWEVWIWQQAWAFASRGRCYGHITKLDAQGYPLSIVPVPDEAVTWRFIRSENQWATYLDNKRVERYPLGPLWHAPLYTLPGKPMGMNPIAYHAETVGLGLAAQGYAGRFFGDGGHPTVLFKTEKDPGPGGAQALKDKILALLGGSREPIVLPKGTTMEKWQVAPEDALYLETMGATGQDVARIFGVPPGKIGLAISGQNVTYTNTESGNTEWKSSGLTRYTTLLEASLTRLVPAGPNRRIRFNYKGFLRGDLAARAAAYKIFAEIGDLAGVPVMTVNEMRADEGLAPLEGGDVFARRTPPQPVQSREDH